MDAHTGPAVNRAEMYDAADRYIAEIYDRTETQRDDVALILSLLGECPNRVLEPFCGHGRILLPLVLAGHQVTGLDLSRQLLQILQDRLVQLAPEVQTRATWCRADVIADDWPCGFDAVVLGANCLYELATAAEQEHCIQAAAGCLRPGGMLFLDNNHMEGPLDPSWTRPGVDERAFPTGVCADGTQITGTCQTVWHDAARRLVRFRRTVTIRTPDGQEVCREWMQQKHPPSTEEMTSWLSRHGFEVRELWGDRHRAPYSDSSDRAVFWAAKA